MTDHELRDLMRAHADEITLERDLAVPAWRAGRRTRRRRAVVSTGAAALAVATVVGGVSVLDRPSETAPALTPGTPTPTRAPSESASETPTTPPGSTTPDARIGGTRVFLAASPDDPAALPLQREGRPSLPDKFDLGAEAPSVAEAPIRFAEAALAVQGPDVEERVLLLAPDGTPRSLDISRLDAYDVQGGGATEALPVHDAMLSPTGRYLAFPQVGRIATYDVARDTWGSIPVDPVPELEWLGDTDLWLRSSTGAGPLVDVRTGRRSGGASRDLTGDALRAIPSASPRGRSRLGPYGTAQTVVLEQAPTDESTAEVFLGEQPELLVAATGNGDEAAGLLVGEATDEAGRPAACCTVASWGQGEGVGQGVLVYQWAPPGATTAHLLSWTVGTHRVERVTEMTGVPEDGFVVTSWARLWD
ncbi:hypothetical protein [Nocardioides nanhaiensis]|uniref:WD40 repeat domain-containing protein n=1 Tax=Nocardioides nanhaiensis TaxID=1476871 RepID=A0ABP8VW41_9ACTN